MIDPQKLSAALKDLDADENMIKTLRLKADNAADRFGVCESEMVDQIWFEWLYHHTRVLVEHGAVFRVSCAHPFIFNPVRPMEWQQNHPTKRDFRTRGWWYGRQKIFPQQARLVYAMLGMYCHTKVRAPTGRAVFP